MKRSLPRAPSRGKESGKPARTTGAGGEPGVEFNLTEAQGMSAASVRRRAEDPHVPFDVAQVAAEQGPPGRRTPEAGGGRRGGDGDPPRPELGVAELETNPVTVRPAGQGVDACAWPADEGGRR